jgi:hypothetical protein
LNPYSPADFLLHLTDLSCLLSWTIESHIGPVWYQAASLMDLACGLIRHAYRCRNTSDKILILDWSKKVLQLLEPNPNIPLNTFLTLWHESNAEEPDLDQKAESLLAVKPM